MPQVVMDVTTSVDAYVAGPDDGFSIGLEPPLVTHVRYEASC
ncbi:MAG: hypothetical protein V7637_4471 [Mycobacteriales bacterium]|jgi:hypothetical protein